MRPFQGGGAAAGGTRSSTHESRTEGTVLFHDLAYIERETHLVARSRRGELFVVDDTGRERERHPVDYGAKLFVRPGERIEPGTLLAEWDPFNIPVITDVGGVVRFRDVLEDVTISTQVDELTGLLRQTVIDTKAKNFRPHVGIRDDAGEVKRIPGLDIEARYERVPGAVLAVYEGQVVLPGDVLAKIPSGSARTRDITGGLARIVELFEARKPKDSAVISEIDGVVSFGKDTKGKRRVIVMPEVAGELSFDLAHEYLVPKAKLLAVRAGDRVRAGEALVDGAANPHDILKVKGAEVLARHLVHAVQAVYRLQRVMVNDKHIEVIVRQMLRHVRVVAAGDSRFHVDESVETLTFVEENERVGKQGGRPALCEPMLLGVTKASLSTESFLREASIRSTTNVLTQAAIRGRIDHLRGPTENVMMGRLIPAGTGMRQYAALGIEVGSGVEDRIDPEQV